MYREAILRELWGELDSLMYILKTDNAPTEDDLAESWQEWGEIRGRAQGVAFAIAMIQNMSEPNIEWVRTEAVRRWENELEGNANPPVPVVGGGGSAVRRWSDHGCLAVAFGVLPGPCRNQLPTNQRTLF